MAIPEASISVALLIQQVHFADSQCYTNASGDDHILLLPGVRAGWRAYKDLPAPPGSCVIISVNRPWLQIN